MNKKILNSRIVSASATAIITFIIYLPALTNAFVDWDDNIYVYENKMITNFNPEFIKWSFTNFVSFNWHPLTWMSHALDYGVWGLNPMGHHLTSIIFHSINIFLVTLLAIRLLEIAGTDVSLRKGHGRLVAGIAAGLLFGLHPLHVESVVWVSERKDVLSAFFFLLSLLSYLNYATTEYTGDKKGHFVSYFFQKYYLLSFAFFFLGLLSKPMIITLPVVLLILDWYPLKRLKDLRCLIQLVSEKIPFFLLSFACSLVTVVAQRGAMASVMGLPLASRLLSAMKSLTVYLEKTFWPVNLIPFYPYPARITIFSFEYFVPVLVLAGITSTCIFILKTKKQKGWLSVWVYYIVTTLPVIGIVQVGKQEFADRYMYLPSIGLFILIGIAAGLLFETLQKRKIAIKTISLFIPLIIIFSISFATARQIAVWKDGITLWSHEIEVLGKNSGKEYLFLNIPFYNRGAAYADRGYWDSAIEDFSMAIYLNQVDFAAYYLRGSMYANKKDYQNALNDYNVAIYLSPNTPDIYYSRAFVYNRNSRRYPEAIDDITKAIDLTAAPPSDYYYNRGMIFKKLGYEKEAARDFHAGTEYRQEKFSEIVILQSQNMD